ncbi:methyl-accepting chemotaxis protein [Halodesulfovibrio marinisediminis]|uniref:Methyl-accepting chemotaxis sensory transducer with Cache sensor n=1 Tax=Halodesulfovibrio marinisediminis DSM 17456 TaxID=1121457 RepID=A0A1N6GLX3_9BACT|nr:methyl-accepting chemotaxis protein [Halodesulfovibrio marinisediminis]SIO08520.1 methyl-accepting chemotaxis sensory transducer with Cache sensor [Halodesulfovibrio marinisediminis DSM 17456]
MFRKTTIRVRVFLLLAVFLLFILGILLFNARSTMQSNDEAVLHLQNMMLDGEKEALHIATHSLALSISSKLNGISDHEEQLHIIQNAIENIRFKEDKSGYFFVYENTTSVAHPIFKNIIGQDRGHQTDQNGTMYVRELKKAAASGGAFVQYVYKKPGQGNQPKLAYAEMIPGTQYWIGTGVYIDNVEKHKNMLQDEFDSRMKESMTTQLAIIGVILLLGFAPFCLFLVRSITTPVMEANEVAQQIAGGNLNVTIKVEGNDEIADLQSSLSVMAETLRNNVQDMAAKEKEAQKQATIAREAAAKAEEAMQQAAVATSKGINTAAERLTGLVTSINSSSSDLAATSRQLEKGSEIQLTRISETATAMEEMNATVLEVARNASDAAERTERSRRQAAEGQSVVNDTINSINELRKITTTLQENMDQLGRESDAIGQVMTIINDIADQTNLLALNAAIEAARAGDAGRGFAVVADEVRKLAEKTMGATSEVGNSINTIQQLAQKNIKGMEESAEAMLSTEQRSKVSGEMLESIVEMTDAAAAQVQSIATAAEEQSAASEEITRSIEEVNAIANESRSMAGNAEQSVSALHNEARNLQEIIYELKEEAAR